MEAVLRAIEGGGGLRSVADKLGVRYQAVQKWRASGRVPAERVLALEAVSGVSRSELRPDLYPLETSVPSTVARRKRA
jgi:DNA-binding transcriptional regulator YdaS (Cro superfamily)